MARHIRATLHTVGDPQSLRPRVKIPGSPDLSDNFLPIVPFVEQSHEGAIRIRDGWGRAPKDKSPASVDSLGIPPRDNPRHPKIKL